MTHTITADVDLDANFPVLPGATQADVRHTEVRRGEPVAVVDAALPYGAQWAQYSETTELIAVHPELWGGLSESGKNFLVAHEAAERDLAREAGDIGGDLSPSEIVDKHHDAANREAVDVVGEEAATQYARDMFELTDDEHAVDAAMHVLRGVEHLVPEEIRVQVV